MKGPAFLVAALLLALPAAAAEPPAALAPYIEDGALRAGDYGWVRGAFDGASAEEKAAYESTVAWRDACEAEARSAIAAEVAEFGRELRDNGNAYGGSLLCRTAYPPKLEAFADYAQLETATASVKPLFASYMAAADRAESWALSNATTIGEQLQARSLGDQVLRNALILAWGRREPFSGLNEAENACSPALFNDAALAHDLANTEWLKAHVADHGWPTVSEVGPRGAHSAWLLAQHSDLDPA